MLSGTFKSLAAAKARRKPGERTVRLRTAYLLLEEQARSIEHRDNVLALAKRHTEVLEENAYLKASTAGQTEPVHAVADLPEKTWGLLAAARLALAGLGRVRPKQLLDGRYSTTEVEVSMTEHEVAVLDQKLNWPLRVVKLSDRPARVNP